MSAVIDLEAERGKRDVMTTDANGRPLFLYSAVYRHDGLDQELELWAYDFADAERQVTAIRSSLVLVGQIMARIDE